MGLGFTAGRPAGRANAAAIAASLLALTVAACGGGDEDEVRKGIRDYLSSPDVQFNVGLNSGGVIVGVDQSVASNFQPTAGERRFDEIEVGAVEMKEDDSASAPVSFRMTTGGSAVRCEASSLSAKRDGSWEPQLFTVSSCTP